MEENWDSEDDGRERWGRWRRGGWGGGGVVRYFPWCDLFLCPIYDFEFFVLFLAEGGASPSGRDGRQETEKIVYRHSLVRLNASMKQKKKGGRTGGPVAQILFTAYLVLGVRQRGRRTFVDDVAWRAEGESEKEVAGKLSRAAEVMLLGRGK